MAALLEASYLQTEAVATTSDEDAPRVNVEGRSHRWRLATLAASLVGACVLAAAAGRPAGAAMALGGGAVERGDVIMKDASLVAMGPNLASIKAVIEDTTETTTVSVADADTAAALVETTTLATSTRGFVNPFGYAGPAISAEAAQDYLVGAIPKYEPVSAHFGTPPRLPGPNQWPTSGCPGMRCGSSCCSRGSICCNANIGLCCAGGTMCCWGEMCCAPSFDCGQTRDFSSGLRFQFLKQCGGGAQLRRLREKLHEMQREGPADQGALPVPEPEA